MERSYSWEQGYGLIWNTFRHEPDIEAALAVETAEREIANTPEELADFKAGAEQALADLAAQAGTT